MATPTVFVIATADTKAAELAYVTDVIRGRALPVRSVDVGTRSDGAGCDISPQQVAAAHPQGATAVFSDDRGKAVSAMAVALQHFLSARDDVAGVIGLGGSGGTALITAAMRALPIGVPKLMLSTMASGNVAPYVGPCDITMMYSVTDVAGLNRISRVVLANAAHAMAGMVAHRKEPVKVDEQPALGLSMFGVTTPCVEALVDALENRYDCLVFHATGTGGQSMEKLADSGMLSGLIDVTTTEIADHIVGGVLSAGPDRLGAVVRTGLPYVGSCGALDMVNFGGKDTVPKEFRDRLLYVHNEQVTLMRTTAAECAQIGAFIAEKLQACKGPIRFLIPEKGVSMLDAEGQAFYDQEADAALFATIEEQWRPAANQSLQRLPYHINDPEFAAAVIAAWKEVS